MTLLACPRCGDLCPPWATRCGGCGARLLPTSAEAAAVVIVQRPRPVYRHCPYCGVPCRGPACRLHRNLLALDPSQPRSHVEATR